MLLYHKTTMMKISKVEMLELQPRMHFISSVEERLISSSSYPQQCSALRKNGYVMLKNRPCKIMEMSTSKTGKHGHAKVSICSSSSLFKTSSAEHLDSYGRDRYFHGQEIRRYLSVDAQHERPEHQTCRAFGRRWKSLSIRRS